MGVRITDEQHVAIFDSVSGTAFGPTFSSSSSAQDFLDWLPRSEGDPRDMRETRLMQLFDRWRQEGSR